MLTLTEVSSPVLLLPGSTAPYKPAGFHGAPPPAELPSSEPADDQTAQTSGSWVPPRELRAGRQVITWQRSTDKLISLVSDSRGREHQSAACRGRCRGRSTNQLFHMHPGHTQKLIVERELESTGLPPAGPPLTHRYTEPHTHTHTDRYIQTHTHRHLSLAAARCFGPWCSYIKV